MPTAPDSSDAFIYTVKQATALLQAALTMAPAAVPPSSGDDADAPLYYTLDEAAARLHISPNTYYRRVRTGELPGRKLGGRWRVSRAALRRYVEAQRDETTQKTGEAS